MCGILKEMSQQVDDDDNNFVLRIKQKNFFVFSPSFEVCLYFNSLVFFYDVLLKCNILCAATG